MQHICTYLPDGELYHDGEVYAVLRFDAAGGLITGHSFPDLAAAHAYGLALRTALGPVPVRGVRGVEGVSS